MPYPGKNESQEEYIHRAVREFISEGFKQKEALGRAYGFWETYKNKKKGKPPSDKTGMGE